MTTAAEYEAFIASLVTKITKQLSTAKLGHGPRNKLTGISGAKHQLDVSFIDQTDSLPTLIIYECKHLKDPIGLSDVKILKATMDDLINAPGLPTRVKAIFVSTKGLRGRGTAKYAKYYGIEAIRISNSSNYSFPYKGHKVAGATASGSEGVYSSSTSQAFKSCQNCGKVFDATGNKPLCPECVAQESTG